MISRSLRDDLVFSISAHISDQQFWFAIDLQIIKKKFPYLFFRSGHNCSFSREMSYDCIQLSQKNSCSYFVITSCYLKKMNWKKGNNRRRCSCPPHENVTSWHYYSSVAQIQTLWHWKITILQFSCYNKGTAMVQRQSGRPLRTSTEPHIPHGGCRLELVFGSRANVCMCVCVCEWNCDWTALCAFNEGRTVL